MTHKPFHTMIALALGAQMALTGCSGVKQQLGVGRQSPDEFTVVKRAPLSVPPNYELRPPSENNAPPPETEARQQARTVLLGAAPSAATTSGSSEDLFLQKMGAQNADPSIRDDINRDNGYLALKNQTVADKLIFWKDDAGTRQAPASVVNASKEQDRLKKNMEEGKPVNTGDVPVIEKKESTIEKLF